MVFTQGPSAHLPTLSTRAGLGTIFRSSGIARFVHGGVVKTFRCRPQMIDWANSQDLVAMLSAIPDGSHEPELRLFCADCAARGLRFLTEPVFSNALDCSRRFATGAANATDLQSLVDAACALIPEHIDVPTVRELAASAVIDASSVSPTSKSKIDCVAVSYTHLTLPTIYSV